MSVDFRILITPLVCSSSSFISKKEVHQWRWLHTWLNSYNSGIVWNINVWMYCMNSLKKTFLIHKGYIRSKGITLREKHGPLTPPLTFLWWQTASLISKNPNTAIDVLPSYYCMNSIKYAVGPQFKMLKDCWNNTHNLSEITNTHKKRFHFLVKEMNREVRELWYKRNVYTR
jgi:hypothetical protein